MYGSPNLEHVERLASLAREHGPRPSNLEPGRVVIGYGVRPHAWQDGTRIPTRWGVWPVWQYADRPDLYGDGKPNNGGPFMPIADLEKLAK